LITYLSSGVIAGYIAKRSPLMHGALLGLLVMGIFAGLSLVAENFSWADLSSVAFVQKAFGAMMVCSLGAIVGNHIASRRAAP